MATDQLSPEMGSSVPQVERLSLNDGELSELERGKEKSITTGLDDPQQMIEDNYKYIREILFSLFFYLSPFLLSFSFIFYILLYMYYYYLKI